MEYGHRSVQLADHRSGDAFQRLNKRTTHAAALHQAGHLAEAEQLFRQAEVMQREEQPYYPFLYALPGYLYCDLLLALHRPAEVRERAEKTLAWAKMASNASNFDFGLDHLTLGRAFHRLDEPDTADSHVAQAVDFLRKANAQEFLVLGLLARAAFYREQGQFAAARRDLNEVLEIAERCGMRLFLTDYHLESCRLGLAENELPTAREHLDTARKLVAETGYHRRDREVQELEKLLAAADMAGK